MNETTDAAAIFAPLWKRKWLILLVGVLVAGATYLYYKHQPSRYSASTQLDLNSGAEARQLVGGAQGRTTLGSHAIADAATLIDSSAVTEAVRARLRAEHAHTKGLGKVHAKASSESDFVTITAEAGSPKAAARLANDYAQAYVERQRGAYRHEIGAAIASTRRQLRRIEAAQAAAASAAQRANSGKGKGSQRAATGGGGSAVIQAASLASKINLLEAELSVSSIQQVNPAKPTTAQLIAPKPKENAIFAFVLGILIAAVAVFALSRLDRRVHSLEQLEIIFDAPLLAALPRAPRPIEHGDGEPRPAAQLLEPLRRLHTSLQLAHAIEPEREGPPRLILFVSADAGEGRSTVIADLALVQRDAGARVAVIDADLRQPAQAGLLGVNASSGLVEVLAGAVSRDGAMRNVGATERMLEIDDDPARAVAAVSTAVRAPSTGSLSLLAGGGPAANPPALLAGQAMQELLRAAAGDFDYVLVDAPPPLRVSDVMPLLRTVDGIVVVARPQSTREVSAERLAKLLAGASAAPVLGVIANCASRGEIGKYGFSATSEERRWPGGPTAR